MKFLFPAAIKRLNVFILASLLLYAGFVPSAVAATAYSFINASPFQAQSGAVATWDHYIGQLGPTSWVEYQNVDFGTAGANQVSISVSVDNQNAGQGIQVRLGSITGAVVATLTTASTGGWNTFVMQSAKMNTIVTGTQNVFLTFTGYGGIANIGGLQFTNTNPPATSSRTASGFINAALYDAVSGGIVTWDHFIGQINPGAWVEYKGVNFGTTGDNTVSISLAVGTQNAGQGIQLRLGSPTGTVVGTLTTTDTTGWNNFVNQTASLNTTVTGVQDLYLTFTGYGGVANIGGLQFSYIQPVTTPAPAPITVTTTPLATPAPPTPVTPATPVITPAEYTATNFINAAPYDGAAGVATWDHYIGQLSPGSWVEYKNVDFGTTGLNQVAISLSVDAQNAGQGIQLRLGSPTGTVVGTLTTTSTNGWNSFVNESASLVTSVTGTQNLFLTFTGYGGIANIGGLQFSRSIAPPVVTPAAPTVTKPSYFVSASAGNDSWTGLLASPNAAKTDGPFKTIAKAQLALRGGSIKLVMLENGTYSVNQIFSFNLNDNGEKWISYPGQTPVLDGAGVGGLDVENTDGLVFEGLTINNTGMGIVLNSATNSVIRWNAFNACLYNCVVGNNTNGDIVDSNTMTGTGSTQTFNAAIYIHYNSNNNQVTHNLIQNFQAAGVTFAAGPTEINNNNLIDRNIIKNVDLNINDSGAIYILDRSHKSLGYKVTNNIVDGNNPGGIRKAFYLDDETSNVTLTGNICRACGSYALQIHGGDNNIVRNNIFDLTNTNELGLYQDDPTFGNFGMQGNVFTGNIIYSGTNWPWNLWDDYQGGSGPMAALNDYGNLYYSTTGAIAPINGEKGSSTANPLFANPAGGNYTMPSNSPAYSAIGFAPLATDQGPVAQPSDLE